MCRPISEGGHAGPPIQKALIMQIIITLFILLSTTLPASAHYEGELLPDSVAVMEYSMVISMNPKDNLTRNKLGMVYIRQRKLDKAREQFSAIIKNNPADFDGLDSLGIVSDREGRYAEAAEWYKKAFKVRPSDPGVKARLDSAAARSRPATKKIP